MAFALSFTFSMFIFSVTRLRMADVFANSGRNSPPFAFSCFILRRRPDGSAAFDLEGGVMLSVCVKGDYLAVTPLSAAEDAAMRKAFGRFATAEARSAGAEIVQRYQHQGHGNWFLCGCLNGPEARPPVLIPVLEGYMARSNERPIFPTSPLSTKDSNV
jgi:hypothetical protein